ncbi:MAG: ABC transporter permease [Bacteroidales bacterium]|nr:ABC transporter permease [Candidatus Equimonas faecalis]
MLTKLNIIFCSMLRVLGRDKGVLIFCILLPLGYPLLYTWLYSNETVREVPTVVVDQCNTALSREYIRKVDASPDVRIVAHAQDINGGQDFIRRREAYGVIAIPRNFERDILRGQQSSVRVFVDMSGMLYYKSILTSATNVSLEMNAKIKASTRAIKYEDVSLYNPSNGFAGFLIPAVLVLILQQTLILGIGLARGTERELKQFTGFQQILNVSDSQRVTLATTGAFLLLYIPITIYVLGIVPKMFSLNTIGNFWELWVFMLPYLLACIFFGLSIGSLCRQRESIILLAVFTSIPFLFLSGVSWPGSNLPPFWKNFSAVIPSTYGITGYIKLNSMGAHLPEVWTEWRNLWIQAGGWFLLAYFSVIRQLWPESFHEKPTDEQQEITNNSK